MSERPPLIFIRHGETDWNRQARFQGQQDVPLNALGRRQAARNGRAIAGMLAAREWRCVASNLSRSIETMEILLAAAGRPGQRFDVDPCLREVSYGGWEGFTLAEINAQFPEAAKARDLAKWDFAPPAGESYAMLSDRCMTLIGAADGPTLVVAHGGILRVLLHRLAGLPSHDAPHLAVPQDRVILFTSKAVLTI
jgi:broad specificity phosphatase PhoE